LADGCGYRPTALGLPTAGQAHVVVRLHEGGLRAREGRGEGDGQVRRQVVTGFRDRRSADIYAALTVLQGSRSSRSHRTQPDRSVIIKQVQAVCRANVPEVAGIGTRPSGTEQGVGGTQVGEAIRIRVREAERLRT